MGLTGQVVRQGGGHKKIKAKKEVMIGKKKKKKSKKQCTKISILAFAEVISLILNAMLAHRKALFLKAFNNITL